MMQPIDYERFKALMLKRFRHRYNNDPEFRLKVDSRGGLKSLDERLTEFLRPPLLDG